MQANARHSPDVIFSAGRSGSFRAPASFAPALRNSTSRATRTLSLIHI